MVKWDKEFSERGLAIVAVYGEDKKGLDGLKSYVRDKGVRYPLLFDPSNNNYRALGLRAYPAAFLLDSRGKVIWEGIFIKRNFESLRKLIVGQLRPGEKQDD